MHDQAIHRARIVSSVAATAVSLACGTNYVYSAWAPQFADKLRLSATQSNLIGLAGNLGMYSLGVPIGIFVDSRGSQPAVLAGAVLLGFGYFPLRQAYNSGAAPSVALLCVFSYLTGLGGCMAFAAAVKTSAINWPHHRGTATAFPLAAFGLSAFFFSVLGSLLYPGDTGAFLMLLAVGTFGLTISGFFFIRVLPHHGSTSASMPYHAVPVGADGEALIDSQRLRRSASAEEPGRSPNEDDDGSMGLYGASVASTSAPVSVLGTAAVAATTAARPGLAEEDADLDSMDETSSLTSKASSLPGDVLVQSTVDMDRSHRIDIRGWALLRNVEFWQFFVIMGILAGIGLMSINNIGHDANALWKHYDGSVDDNVLVKHQQIHVSILSLASFSGRLLSGIGSDFLVKHLHASRVWCLVAAAVIFVMAQVCAIGITNPHLLGFVSGLSGLGYGILFGVSPSLVAEAFGIHGLSQNWGLITMSPVLSGNVFNLFYGKVFDRHSVTGPNGERTCTDGPACYRAAYCVTLAACFLGLVVTLYVIRHQHHQREKEAGKRSLED